MDCRIRTVHFCFYGDVLYAFVGNCRRARRRNDFVRFFSLCIKKQAPFQEGDTFYVHRAAHAALCEYAVRLYKGVYSGQPAVNTDRSGRRSAGSDAAAVFESDYLSFSDARKLTDYQTLL